MSEKTIQEKLVESNAVITYVYLTRLIQSDLAIVENVRAKIDVSLQAAQSDPKTSPEYIAAMRDILTMTDFVILHKTQTERSNP